MIEVYKSEQKEANNAYGIGYTNPYESETIKTQNITFDKCSFGKNDKNLLFDCAPPISTPPKDKNELYE